MPKIAVEPIVLNDCLLTLGANDFEAHVSKVEFVPSSSIVNWKGLTPSSVHSFPTRATWVCNLDFAQDIETANSLSLYLHENEGEEVPATFEPKVGGASITADIFASPGSLGGSIDAVPVSSVSLGVKGKPEIVPAT